MNPDYRKECEFYIDAVVQPLSVQIIIIKSSNTTHIVKPIVVDNSCNHAITNDNIELVYKGQESEEGSVFFTYKDKNSLISQDLKFDFRHYISSTKGRKAGVYVFHTD